MKKRVLCLIMSFLFIFAALPVKSGEYYSTFTTYFPFEDVPCDAWYAPAAELCYANSFMNGVSKASFDPYGTTTREQAVMILANLSGEDISGYDKSSFSDVEEGKWYSNAVAWAKEKGYTNGKNGELFGLGEPLSRQAAVTFFYNYFKENNYEMTYAEDLSEYSDAGEVGEWALQAMLWASENGIIKGNKGKLSPKDTLTRAASAQMIYNAALELLNECEHNFSGGSCTEPSVCYGCSLIKDLPRGHRVEKGRICEEFTKCTDCGDDMFIPGGHIYEKASCTEPMKCKRCGKTEGEPLGHTSDNKVCFRCKEEYFKSGIEKLTYYLTEKGMDDGGKKYFYTKVTYNNGAAADQYIILENSEICFKNIYSYPNSNDTLDITYRLNAASYSANYTKYGTVSCSGSGFIKVKDYTAGQKLSFTDYAGLDAQKTDFEALVSNAISLNFDAASFLLERDADMTLSELGFVK